MSSPPIPAGCPPHVAAVIETLKVRALADRRARQDARVEVIAGLKGVCPIRHTPTDQII